MPGCLHHTTYKLLPLSIDWGLLCMHQGLAYGIVNHECWPPFMVTLLVFNMVLLATSSYDEPQQWTRIINGLDAGCVCIYFIEMCLRLMAAGRFRSRRRYA